MKVLNLVTNRSPFFVNQVKILRELGIKSEVVEVPNDSPRTIKDYLNFYPKVFSSSLSEKFTLVHANYGLTAPYAWSQPQRPLILTLWGSDLRFLLQKDLKGLFFRKLAHLDLFNEIIVRNEEMKEKVKSNFGEEAHVIPSGVNLQKFKPMKKEETQRKIGWNIKNKHILFPYDPSREVKNFSLAQEIYEEVDENLEFDVDLQVVSGVTHEDIPKYMNAADLMLLTSKSEGSPNTVKEAMSCNTPVVSTDVGDVSHLLKGVKNSKVGENKKELVEGVIDIINNNKNLSNGRKRVKELDLGLDTMGKKIIKVYRKALEEE